MMSKWVVASGARLTLIWLDGVWRMRCVPEEWLEDARQHAEDCKSVHLRGLGWTLVLDRLLTPCSWTWIDLVCSLVSGWGPICYEAGRVNLGSRCLNAQARRGAVCNQRRSIIKWLCTWCGFSSAKKYVRDDCVRVVGVEVHPQHHLQHTTLRSMYGMTVYVLWVQPTWDDLPSFM